MMKRAPIALAAVAALSACSVLQSRRLSRSPDLPKAEAVVRFARLAGDDTGIELKARGLCDPDALPEPGYVYVAWVRRSLEDPPHNVGALVFKEDEAVLRASTSLRRFDLFVTAEATSDAVRPTGERLLWTRRE